MSSNLNDLQNDLKVCVVLVEDTERLEDATASVLSFIWNSVMRRDMSGFD